MTGDRNFLLIGVLLQGALCGKFKLTVPKSVEVLSGSCVTIPCSFDVEDKYNSALDETCKALWNYDKDKYVFDSSKPQSSAIQGELNGDLKRKDCTTTLNNMRPEHSKEFRMRLECKDVKVNFDEKEKLHISVTDVPPTPTLTPSTLKVEEGASVSLKCSAPAPCLSHPPALTWNSSLGHIQESLQENLDRTKVKTSVLNFTASRLHHGLEISCTAVYTKQDGSSQSAHSERLTLNVSFVTVAPVIVPLSHCIDTADQLNCSCETVGNPPPALQWYLDGSPVNHSDRFAISSDDTGLRSFITVKQTRGRDFNLSCHSTNSLGSTTQQLPVYYSRKTTCAHQAFPRRIILPIFIAIAGGITASLVCALLVAIRTQRKPTKSECTGDTRRAMMSRGLAGEMENKVSITPEEDIYVNTNEMRKSDKLETQRGRQHVASQSSERQDEEGSDMLYASVVWKSKKKRKKKGDHSGGNNSSGSLYLEEERCAGGGTGRNVVSNAQEMGSLYGNTVTVKNAQKAFFSEYAQVTFR